MRDSGTDSESKVTEKRDSNGFTKKSSVGRRGPTASIKTVWSHGLISRSDNGQNTHICGPRILHGRPDDGGLLAATTVSI